jgi:FAD synthase
MSNPYPRVARLKTADSFSDYVASLGINLPFDEEMRRTSFERFTVDILVGGLGIRGLLFGYNSNFGRDGEGFTWEQTTKADILRNES